jgi:FkbM family methyltransferase
MRADFEYPLNYFLQKLELSKGFFVDVGANDGIKGSMTFDLEKNGWRGILIEPNPTLVKTLKENRSSPVFPYGVSSSEGEMLFYIVDGPDNLHGLSRFHYSLEFEEHVKSLNGLVKPTQIQVKKLKTIMNESNIFASVDFLKVDVEGHELEVLKSFDFEKFQPKLIVTEDNFKDRDKSVRHFLKSKGYEIIARDRINNWFAPKIEVRKFMYDFLHAKVRFLRWDIKRALYGALKREIKTGNH